MRQCQSLPFHSAVIEFALQMDDKPEQKQPKPVNSYRKRGWPDTVSHLGALIISKNLLLPAGALAVILLMIWKLSSNDLRGLVETIIERKWFAVSGWGLFIGSVFVSIKIFKWRDNIFRQHIDELKKLSEPSQEQLKLEANKIEDAK